MSYMGLDVGQTGCRAVIFDENGKQLALSYREYKTLSPQEGWAELDSETVRDSCFTVMKEAQASCRENPVRALGISTQGEAFTPIGPKGEYLANAMITFDTRPAEIAKRWSEAFGVEKLYRITGHTAHPMFSLFKLLWLKENRGDVFGRAERFLCFEDLIQHALGIDPAISWSLAGRTMLFNIRTHAWEDKILNELSITPSHLATPLPSGTGVGTINRDTARGLGFQEEVLVSTAGHDQPLGALGAGVVKSGKAMYATGTSECISPAFDGPIQSDELRDYNLCTYDYTISGMYTTAAFSLTGGNILKWFRDEWCRKEMARASETGEDAYELILRDLGEKPSPLMVLPYFTPSGTPYFDTRTPGAVVGLRLSTKRSDMLRALLEGVAFEMRLNLDILTHSGIGVEELRAIGGGARSTAWIQLKADVLNKPITRVRVTEAACFAAAMLGCSALTGEPVTDIASRWVMLEGEIEPNPGNAAVYGERFEKYRELYTLMRDFSS